MLLTTIEEQGQWWLPSQSERRVAGTIRFEPRRGIVLSTVGILESSQQLYGLQTHETVFGYSETLGVHVLAGCRTWGGPTTLSAAGSSEKLILGDYWSSYLFKGPHRVRMATEHFSSFSVCLTGLESWAKELRLQWDHDPGSGAHDSNVFRIINLEAESINLTSARCEFGIELTEQLDRHRLEIKSRPFATLSATEGKPAHSWINDEVRALRYFISFASGEPCLIRSARGAVADLIQPEDDRTQHWYELLFEDIEARRLVSEEGYISAPVLRNQLVRSGEAFAEDGKLIRRFQGLLASIEPTIRLYLLARDFPESFPYLELQFVAIVNALESFHHRTRPALKYEGVEWNRAKRALADALPTAWRHDVMSEFGLIRTKRLPAMLSALFAECEEISSAMGEERRRIISAIVNTRNYFSHYSKELEAMERLEGREIHAALYGLLKLTEYLILTELGFLDDDALERVQRTRNYFYVGEVFSPN